jgi:hypothetical protein
MIMALVIAALGLVACAPDIGSMGGLPSSGTIDGEATTAGTTTAAPDDTAGTGPSIPEGPRRRRIDLDPSLVADVGGTTLLVVLDASRIEYEDAQPGGADLRMRGPGSGGEGDGPFYPIQIEHWDPEGRSYVWVRIDATPLPTSIWMHYAEGHPYPAIEPAQVWEPAFAAVWHMELGDGEVSDSTVYGHDLHPVGFTGDPDVDGTIGPAAYFTPPAIEIDNGPLELSDAEALMLADGFTLEAWVWPALVTTDTTSHVLRKGSAYELHALEPMLTRPRLVLRTADGTGPHTVEAGTSLTAGTWTHLAATYRADDGMLAFYRNGEPEEVLLVGGDAAGRAVATSEAVVQVGRSFEGILDEVRVSSIARSEAWIRLQHAAMTDRLMTFGPPEPP